MTLSDTPHAIVRVHNPLDGTTTEVPVTADESVMDVLRAHYGDRGDCGGMLICGACHVYVKLETSSASLSAISDDEADMLDNLTSRRDSSRLACQLRLAPGTTLDVERGADE